MIAKKGEALTLNAVVEWLVAYGLPPKVWLHPIDWLSIVGLCPAGDIRRDMIGVVVTVLGCELRPKIDHIQKTLDVSGVRLTEGPCSCSTEKP